MQCGFALVFAGFARAQNVTHTLRCRAAAQRGPPRFLGAGYAMQAHGALFLGTTVDGAEFARFLFLALVAAIAVVIPAGTLMERWRFSSVVFTSLALSTVIYPLVARWVWGGGWMARLGVSAGLGNGVVDFAGGGVVHLVSGVVALGGALAIGPRARKFTYDGQPLAMPGHNVPMFMVASMMLMVGWFGLVVASAFRSRRRRSVWRRQTVCSRRRVGGGGDRLHALAARRARSVSCRALVAGMVSFPPVARSSRRVRPS
jgi:Amt family ammonium transporter